MQTTTLFIDLDDTLYPAGNGLWQVIKDRRRNPNAQSVFLTAKSLNCAR